jgi:hypothetical protein
VPGLSVGTLCDFQGGFRADRSTVEQIFILKEILSFRKELGKHTFVAFLDVKKAYDSVWRPGLLFKLEQAGLGGRCLEIVSLMLTRVTRSVIVRKMETAKFVVTVPLVSRKPGACSVVSLVVRSFY